MKQEYSRLLNRQIRKYLSKHEDMEGLAEFLDAVNRSYLHYESEIKLTERTVELSTEELVEKNRELAHKNELMETFVYRVTHDLKSPAHNIQNMSGMLKNFIGNENPMVVKITGHLEKSAQVLLDRIQDLLSMTRTKYLVNENPVEILLPELLTEVKSSILSRIEETHAEINADFSRLQIVHFPRENMFSILQNLVSNSVKYHHPDRPPVIQITAETIGDEACITVADNGLGMDLEKYGDKLFGMFTRFHNHIEGSGVGLFILKKIMDENGGRIEVQSRLNEGTKFKIWFKNILIHEKA
ncbi:MAG: HAMP domain-containing histidine kinase [Bacteroidia bacterium]|nr:HAMP domain-containing histidine kinase [Bacteroidia bacterium]